ncbi:MAG: DUF2079 domain-containing protein [Actinomycetota bacterium]|nr:DUF2079 domain-containing protein [Actinomycetota bacterium]
MKRPPAASDDPERWEIVTSLAARVGLGLAVAGYVAVLVPWVLRQHYGFSTFGFDLGIFDQGVWLLSRFEEPFVTVRGLNLFGDHTSFILLLLVPFYWLAPSASVLLIAQTAALAGAVLPVWFIARDRLRDENLALAAAIAYLAHPAVALTNLENFHPDSFEIPLVFGVLFFMMHRRWVGYTICLIGLLLVKEDVPLMTFVLGLYVAVRYDRKVGLLTSVGSLMWLGATLFLIFPALNGSGTLYGSRIGGAFGGTAGLLKTALLRPWDVLAVAFGPDKPWYLWQMGAPLAGMFLLSPGLAAVALLPLLSNLLSSFPYQHQIEFHYGTLIVPVLVTAAIFGIARLRSPAARTNAVIVMTASALVSGYLWGPVGRAPRGLADPSSERAVAIREAIALIPEDAAVSAAFFTVPHLTHREHIYEFPVPWRAQNWGDNSSNGARLSQTDLIDYVLVEYPMAPEMQEIVDSLDAEGFSEAFRSDGMLLLQREGR